MYLRNGEAGFVLKPAALLDPEYPFNLRKYKPTKHILRVHVISAQQLPRPKDDQGHELVDKDTVDPYVKVALHIPIWANGQSIEGVAPIPVAPVVSTDQKVGTKEEGKVISLAPKGEDTKPGEVGKTETKQEAILVESGAAGDEQAGAAVREREVKVKTKTVRNNGFNPVWDEHLELPFDVFGGDSMRDLIFVRFLVKDSNMDEDDFVGAYCTSLSCLELGKSMRFYYEDYGANLLYPGYRHLPLYDEQTNQILFAGLFVHLSIEDA
jgi:phosphatidylinositol phospholipase C, delta